MSHGDVGVGEGGVSRRDDDAAVFGNALVSINIYVIKIELPDTVQLSDYSREISD